MLKYQISSLDNSSFGDIESYSIQDNNLLKLLKPRAKLSNLLISYHFFLLSFSIYSSDSKLSSLSTIFERVWQFVVMSNSLLELLFTKESTLEIVYLWLVLSTPTTFLLILLPKVALAKGLVTKLGISLPRAVILEGVSISGAGVRIVNKFLLRALLKTSPIQILVVNSSGILSTSGVAVYSSLMIY